MSEMHFEKSEVLDVIREIHKMFPKIAIRREILPNGFIIKFDFTLKKSERNKIKGIVAKKLPSYKFKGHTMKEIDK